MTSHCCSCSPRLIIYFLSSLQSISFCKSKKISFYLSIFPPFLSFYIKGSMLQIQPILHQVFSVLTESTDDFRQHADRVLLICLRAPRVGEPRFIPATSLQNRVCDIRSLFTKPLTKPHHWGCFFHLRERAPPGHTSGAGVLGRKVPADAISAGWHCPLTHGGCAGLNLPASQQSTSFCVWILAHKMEENVPVKHLIF